MKSLKQNQELTTNQQLVILLNRLLADNINLKLQAKQAHWNFKGPNFISLHELFDRVATESDGYADMLAERAVQLGGVATGTLEEVKKHSQLEAYPAIIHPDQYTKILAESLTICANEARHSVDLAVESDDPLTADLFTEVARGLDKSRWLVESHLTK